MVPFQSSKKLRKNNLKFKIEMQECRLGSEFQFFQRKSRAITSKIYSTQNWANITHTVCPLEHVAGRTDNLNVPIFVCII